MNTQSSLSKSSGAKDPVVCSFGNLTFREMDYAVRSGRPRHVHEENYLIFFLRGTGEEERKRKTFVRKPSTLILMPADEPHATYFPDGVRTLEIELAPDWAERFRQASAEKRLPAMDCESGTPVQVAARLYQEFKCPDDLSPLLLEGLTLELLSLMLRDANQTTASSTPRWLRQVRDFLHAHFRENPSLDRIAETVGVHPAHLTRAFRQQYDCTLGDYARKLRVEHACGLLARSEMPLAAVALEAGFSDQSHLSRTFKSLTGMTPAEYRKVFRNAVPS